jgi:hypothetical protein
MTMEYPSRFSFVSLGLALFLLLLGQQKSFSQAVTEDQVKAAYMYNFAKFADWPAEAFTNADDPIRLCILNDQPFYSQLIQIAKDKTIAGRAVRAVPVQNGQQARGCHMLFIDSAQAGDVVHLFETLQGSSVLTVGETESFVDQGGIIGFVMQGGQVHFQVNHKAANQSGIRLSSRLLSVAKRVIE